jgi:hypothetical protein
VLRRGPPRDEVQVPILKRQSEQKTTYPEKLDKQTDEVRISFYSYYCGRNTNAMAQGPHLFTDLGAHCCMRPNSSVKLKTSLKKEGQENASKPTLAPEDADALARRDVTSPAKLARIVIAFIIAILTRNCQLQDLYVCLVPGLSCFGYCLGEGRGWSPGIRQDTGVDMNKYLDSEMCTADRTGFECGSFER